MKHSRIAELMNTVLDGEASAEHERELERSLAGDPALQREFEELRGLFDGLRAVPARFAPEGLVAAVMANIPQNPIERRGDDQLSFTSGVFGPSSKSARDRSSGKSEPVRPILQPWALSRGENMSESNSRMSNKNKMLIGDGI